MLSALYALLRLINDLDAVAKGKPGQRIVRRTVGKATGRALGRVLR